MSGGLISTANWKSQWKLVVGVSKTRRWLLKRHCTMATHTHRLCRPMFLVVVDAHSKWPEVILVSSTTSSLTIEVLRDLFARLGIPEQIVSDNGAQFVFEEFQAFIRSNGIGHITSAPYQRRQYKPSSRLNVPCIKSQRPWRRNWRSFS